MPSATTTTADFRMTLGRDERKQIEVVVEYAYTPPARPSPYCGHDGPDRPWEPSETELVSVCYQGADLLPFLSGEIIDTIQTRAERVAENAYDRREL